MSETNKLSVCAHGCGQASHVEECISSIWAGGHENVEIIALDDGSDDETLARLEASAKQSPFPIKILDQKHSGNMSANFNRLLAEASGGYVLFLTMDEMPMPGALGRLMRVAVDGNLAFAAHTDALFLGKDGFTELVAYGSAQRPNTIDELHESEYASMLSFPLAGAVFRRDVPSLAGGFDDAMIGHDISLRTRIFRWLKKTPNSFGLIDGPGCILRGKTGNFAENIKRALKAGFEYYDRMWPEREYPQAMKNWLIWGLGEISLEELLPVIKSGKKSGKLLVDAEVKKVLQQAEKKP